MSTLRHNVEEALSHAADARARLLTSWKTSRAEAVLDALAEIQSVEAHLADAFGALSGEEQEEGARIRELAGALQSLARPQ